MTNIDQVRELLVKARLMTECADRDFARARLVHHADVMADEIEQLRAFVKLADKIASSVFDVRIPQTEPLQQIIGEAARLVY